VKIFEEKLNTPRTNMYLSFPGQSAREVRARLHDKDQTQAALTLSHSSWGHFSRNKLRKRDSLDVSSRLHV
jgi:hypothetical protein